MRLRVRLKSLCVLGLLSVCVLVYTFFSVHIDGGAGPHSARIARVTTQDLVAAGLYTDLVNSENINNTNSRLLDAPASPALTQTLFNLSAGGSTPCGAPCQLRHLRLQYKVTEAIQHNSTKSPSRSQADACDRTCRKNMLYQQGIIKSRAYGSRVLVENLTLPDSWTVTQELQDRLTLRREHVRQTCRKYGLDKPNGTYQPNAWEFLISKQHGLVWCNVFKAASSTWFYNFNLLAGFTETELMRAKETPVNLIRKKYPRPSVQELQSTLNTTHPPLSFMIVRHPLKRLVSAYRDKVLSGNRYYSKLSRIILKEYQELGPGIRQTGGMDRSRSRIFGRTSPRATVPSFPQFIQYVLDENGKGAKLDEHWSPASTFCTPCLVPFDVFAKVETLEEDGNYIIFTAGIDNIIKPKRINRSRDKPTDEVADKFLCQLTQQQMEGLLQLYKYDVELFQYDVNKFRDCTQGRI